MTDETKAEILRYIASQIAIAKVQNLPKIEFNLKESNEFNFTELAEVADEVHDKYQPTWVLFNIKNKTIKIRVVLK